MEGNNWNNRPRYTSYRNSQDGDDRRNDQDSYRGSYRLDNESKDRNQTTYNGFDRNDRNRHTDNRSAVSMNHNRDFERDSSGSYQNGQGMQDRNSRNQQRSNSGYNNSSDRNHYHYSTRNRYEDESRYNSGNFDANYSPDHYGNGSGQNYGNMAGSLSYGYDGSGNSDFDSNRYYDPLSGHHRSYHGNYTSRQPDFYNDRDRRRNNDDFRPLDR